MSSDSSSPQPLPSTTSTSTSAETHRPTPDLSTISIPTSSSSTTASTAIIGEVVPPTPLTSEPEQASLEVPTRPKTLRHKISGSLLRGVKSLSFGSKKSSDGEHSSAAEEVPTSSPAPPRPSTSSISSLSNMMKSSKGVPLILINQTGFPVQIATWPVRSEEGEMCEMQAAKGDGVMNGSVGEPWKNVDGEVVEIGRVKWPEHVHIKNSHREGWIFFDLLVPQPPSTSSPHATAKPYRLHCQSYLRLTSRTRSAAKVGLGRFDLDSNKHNPMPSGSFGRVEVVFSGDTNTAPLKPAFHHRSSSGGSSIEVVSDSGEDDLEFGKEGKKKKRGSGSKFQGSGEIVEVRYFLTSDVKDVYNEVDDSTGDGSVFLPTKKIQVSSWCSHKEAVVSLVIHKEARYHEHPSHHRHLARLREVTLPHNPFTRLHSNIESSNHDLDGFVSRGCWFFVLVEGKKVFDQLVKINPLGGGVTGPKLVSTADSQVFFQDDLTINYGFYDAGLTKDKQSYVYASHRNTNWLGDMLAVDERFKKMPFEKLVLAGAHDSGMIGHISSELTDFIKNGQVTSSAPQLARGLTMLRFVLSTLSTFNVSARRPLENLAMTQKDSILNQLEMGVRFFDFRPGYTLPNIAAGVPGPLHHMHSVVDGVSYLSFLVDILNFLGDHPTEIVFFELKQDGFPFHDNIYDSSGKLVALSMIPKIDALAEELAAARTYAKSQAAREIVVGGPEDFNKSIGELLEANMRLLIADRVHFADQWQRGDSYTSPVYNTDDPSRIKAALDTTHQDAEKRAATREGPPSTIYQLQATPTAEILADVGASLTYSDASSLLVWAKSVMDRVTYPWIASKHFFEPSIVILLNDFCDGALVELAVEKSYQRAHAWLGEE